MARELAQDYRITRESRVERLLARIRAGRIIPVEGPDDLAGRRVWIALEQEIDYPPLVQSAEVDRENVVSQVDGVDVIVVESGHHRQPAEVADFRSGGSAWAFEAASARQGGLVVADKVHDPVARHERPRARPPRIHRDDLGPAPNLDGHDC